jgi:hypothetical protein
MPDSDNEIEQGIRDIAREVRTKEGADTATRLDSLDAAQNVKLKGWYARNIFLILIVQLLIADSGFPIRGFRSAMERGTLRHAVWLGATVVQVVGVVLVITRYLFPRRTG